MKYIFSILVVLFVGHAFSQFGTITNGDFETWQDDEIYQDPKDWNSSNTTEFYGEPTVFPDTDAAVGLKSAHLETSAVGPYPLTSYVYHGTVGVSGPTGGIPYTDNFEAISLQYKCELAPGDSMYLMIVRYNAGSIVSYNLFPFAFDTVSTWTPTVLYVGNVVSDELFIGFTVGDVTGATPPTPGSWANIDDVQLLVGAAPATPIPNNGFEDWESINVEEPSNWYTLNKLLSNTSAENANKTTDANTGTYAAVLETVMWGTDTIGGVISKGPIDVFSATPFGGTSFTGSPLLLNGAYKYSPAGPTDAFILVEFFETGNSIGAVYEVFSPQSSYTDFHYPVTLTGTPDSMTFIVFSGTSPGAILNIDDLNFSGGGVGITDISSSHIDLYPNPATDQATLHVGNNETCTVNIISLDGRIMKQLSNVKGEITIKTELYPAGIYYVTINSSSQQLMRKLVVE